MTSHDFYLKSIKEMYPGDVIGWLSSNMAFHEDWATTRAVVATMKSMISDKKVV